MKADYAKGWKYRQDFLIKNQNDHMYPLRVSLFELGKYGVGVHLYFRYVKYMVICFGIMTLISIPSLIANLSGDYFEERSNSVLDYTTLGNTKGFDNGATMLESTEKADNYDLLRNMVIYSDFVNTLFFFAFIYVFKYI